MSTGDLEQAIRKRLDPDNIMVTKHELRDALRAAVDVCRFIRFGNEDPGMVGTARLILESIGRELDLEVQS